jgi:hypothetical protein
LLLLLKYQIKFLALLLEFFDVGFKCLVLGLPLLEDLLQLMNNSRLLFDFQDVNVNFMLQLEHLLLVLNNLLVSIDHDKSFGVHLLKQGGLIVHHQLVLGNLLLHGVLEGQELLIVNALCLLLHHLLDLLVHLPDLVLFFLDALHQGLDLLQRPLSVGVCYPGPEVFHALLVHGVPLKVLLFNDLLQLGSLLLGGLNIVL